MRFLYNLVGQMWGKMVNENRKCFIFKHLRLIKVIPTGSNIGKRLII